MVWKSDQQQTPSRTLQKYLASPTHTQSATTGLWYLSIRRIQLEATIFTSTSQYIKYLLRNYVTQSPVCVTSAVTA